MSAKTEHNNSNKKIADNLRKIEKKHNFRRLSAFFQENILDGTLCDLIIDRADNTINLCEVKYSEELYSLDKEEYLKIQHRIKAFKDVTATKSSIIPTMITTFGMKEGIYSDQIIAKIDMEALFYQ